MDTIITGFQNDIYIEQVTLHLGNSSEGGKCISTHGGCYGIEVPEPPDHVLNDAYERYKAKFHGANHFTFIGEGRCSRPTTFAEWLNAMPHEYKYVRVWVKFKSEGFVCRKVTVLEIIIDKFLFFPFDK